VTLLWCPVTVPVIVVTEPNTSGFGFAAIVAVLDGPGAPTAA
jgi:hypothetical protein